MSDDVIKVKALLKIELFHPHKLNRDHHTGWNTGVSLKPANYSNIRVYELVTKCGEPNIFHCYFKGKNSTFGLSLFDPESDEKGIYSLSFLLQDGIDGNLEKNRPSKQEIADFIHFLGGRK